MDHQGIKRNFSSVERCGICRSKRHKYNQCRKECANCKRAGHPADECPEKRCYWCNGKGHIVKLCPKGPSIDCRNCKMVANKDCNNGNNYYCYRCFKNLEGKRKRSITSPTFSVPQKNVKLNDLTQEYESKKGKETTDWWQSTEEALTRRKPYNYKGIKGTKAREVFRNFDIMDIILGIVKNSSINGLEDFLSAIMVNRFLYNNFKSYWIKDYESQKNCYSKLIPTNYIPRDNKAKKFGFTEVRCETCTNFRGSKRWEQMHYYSYAQVNWTYPIMCDYKKDTAWFKLYTKEEKEEILKLSLKLTEKPPREINNEPEEESEIPLENNHEIIMEEEIERPPIRNIYAFDDEIVERRIANTGYVCVMNTLVANENYEEKNKKEQEINLLKEELERMKISNEQLENENETLKKDLEDERKDLDEYKELFDGYWKSMKTVDKVEEILDNANNMEIDDFEKYIDSNFNLSEFPSYSEFSIC